MRDSGGDVVGAGSDSGKIAHQLEPIVDNQPSTVDNLWTSRGLFDAPAEAFSAAEADRLAALAAAGAWDDPAMVELHQRARTLAAQGDAAASVAVEAVRRQHRAGRARTEREHD